jgi:hypothetical protein
LGGIFRISVLNIVDTGVGDMSASAMTVVVGNLNLSSCLRVLQHNLHHPSKSLENSFGTAAKKALGDRTGRRGYGA